MPRKKIDYVTAVADFETDPFVHGRVPKPFCCGFYDGEMYLKFWGDDCAIQLFTFLNNTRKNYRIYMHNGGKFDFFFLYEYLDNPIKIINARIVQAMLGKHEIRDSYAIIPVPLGAYKKDDIDYTKMERNVREKHKEEILSYLKSDCIYLYELVSAFVKRFGPKLTIGGTAIKELEARHPFQHGNEDHDTQYRKFYFGGRVQAFRTGKFDGNLKVYDVNSMYPYVMKCYDHPISTKYVITRDISLTPGGCIRGFEKMPYFLEVEGENYGAFPTRTKEGLDFNVSRGTFFVTSHEMRVALKHKKFKPTKFIEAHIPCFTGNFKAYVDEFYKEKVASKESGDFVGEIFAKLLLNSAYGKFGQDPRNYHDWLILPYGQWPDDDEWQMYEQHESVTIFRKPVVSHSFYDVAIAASITGAARSVLMDAIFSTEDVLYCDTDSIICAGKFGPHVDDKKLGSWKHEATLSRLAIAGKKIYAGSGVNAKGKAIQKIASKGFKASLEDIESLVRGDTFVWESQAPNFKLSGEVKFVKRVVRAKKLQ